MLMYAHLFCYLQSLFCGCVLSASVSGPSSVSAHLLGILATSSPVSLPACSPVPSAFSPGSSPAPSPCSLALPSHLSSIQPGAPGPQLALAPLPVSPAFCVPVVGAGLQVAAGPGWAGRGFQLEPRPESAVGWGRGLCHRVAALRGAPAALAGVGVVGRTAPGLRQTCPSGMGRWVLRAGSRVPALAEVITESESHCWAPALGPGNPYPPDSRNMRKNQLALSLALSSPPPPPSAPKCQRLLSGRAPSACDSPDAPVTTARHPHPFQIHPVCPVLPHLPSLWLEMYFTHFI